VLLGTVLIYNSRLYRAYGRADDIYRACG
jgi:hypothetical protein